MKTTLSLMGVALFLSGCGLDMRGAMAEGLARGMANSAKYNKVSAAYIDNDTDCLWTDGFLRHIESGETIALGSVQPWARHELAGVPGGAYEIDLIGLDPRGEECSLQGTLHIDAYAGVRISSVEPRP